MLELDLENDLPYFEQSFNAKDGREILATIRWNVVSSCFGANIFDVDNSKYLLNGIPLVLGCDIFAPYGKLGLGSLILIDLDQTGIDANINDLNVRIKAVTL